MKILQLLLITLTSLVADASETTLQKNFTNLKKHIGQYSTIEDLFAGTTMSRGEYNPIYSAFVNTDNLGRQVEIGEKVILGKESMTRTNEIQQDHIDKHDDILVAAISTDKNNENTKIEIVENHQVEFDSDGEAWSIFTAVLEMNGLFPQTIDYRGERYFFQGISNETRWDGIFSFKYVQKRDDLLHKSIQVDVQGGEDPRISRAYFSNNKSIRIFQRVEKTEITESLKLLYPIAIAGSDILRGAYQFCTRNIKEDAFKLKYYLKRNQNYYHFGPKLTTPITIEQNPKSEDDAKKLFRNLIGKLEKYSYFDFVCWCYKNGINMEPYTQESAGKLYAKFILRKKN